jgi:hypothetical protein
MAISSGATSRWPTSRGCIPRSLPRSESVVLPSLLTWGRSHAALQFENLRLAAPTAGAATVATAAAAPCKADRWLWARLARAWDDCRAAVVIVKPETVVAWHRQGFRLIWTWKSRRRRGRPPVAPDVRTLIRRMSEHNPLWGAPRRRGSVRVHVRLTCFPELFPSHGGAAPAMAPTKSQSRVVPCSGVYTNR